MLATPTPTGDPPNLLTMWQPTTKSLSAATISFIRVRPWLPLQQRQHQQRVVCCVLLTKNIVVGESWRPLGH
jgi:hypothetical protein